MKGIQEAMVLGMLEGFIKGLPPWDAHHSVWGMDEKYRLGYVRSKYNLAFRYEPKRICEIGVYSGIAACCFLAASPTAEYIGIDNGSADFDIVIATHEKLKSLGYNATVIIDDSQRLGCLPGKFDFIHVDGDHTTQGAKHDTELTWDALTEDGVLLVDDCHNMQVVAGVALALQPLTDLLDWAYYSDGVGTMVIQRKERVR